MGPIVSPPKSTFALPAGEPFGLLAGEPFGLLAGESFGLLAGEPFGLLGGSLLAPCGVLVARLHSTMMSEWRDLLRAHQ